MQVERERAGCDRLQRRRATAPGAAEDKQVPGSRVPAHRGAALLGGQVAEREGHRLLRVDARFGRERVDLTGVDSLGQGREPGRRGCRDAVGGTADGLDVAASVVRGGRRGIRAAEGCACGERLRCVAPGLGNPAGVGRRPRRSGVGQVASSRCEHLRDLHPLGSCGAAPQDGPPRCRREDRGGVRDVEDVDGLGGIRHAQRDTQRDVRPEVRSDGPRGPLRGEHEVHAERAALRGEPKESRQEVRVLVGHRPELVDDDEQPRWG